MPKIWLKNWPLCNLQSVDLRDWDARERERKRSILSKTFLVSRSFTQVICLRPLTNAQGLCFFRSCVQLISSSSVAPNKLPLYEKSIKPQVLVSKRKIDLILQGSNSNVRSTEKVKTALKCQMIKPIKNNAE